MAVNARAPQTTAVTLDPEWVILACALLWLPLVNGRFIATVLHASQAGARPLASVWWLVAALALAVVAIHALMLALLAWGRAFKPVLLLMLVVAACAGHFIDQYGTYIDAAMLRNALNTHRAEASELIGWAMLPPLVLGALIPGWLLWRAPLRQRPLAHALRRRAALIVLTLVALVALIASVFQPLASLTRNHRELRYLITPANVLWAGASLARESWRAPAGPRAPVGTDAVLSPQAAAATKPRVLVFVVGETARAANWGLNGYARNTTPQLAQLPVINFPKVTSCGTDTEISLPCMFSAIGRRDYDERRIRHSESLLHVAARAGVQVQWRDNQSGCKGVCEGLPSTTVAALAPPGLCNEGSCFDEGLLHGLTDALAQARGTHLVVLHQIGNHGPAYFRRVPEAMKVFKPACAVDDLGRCSAEEIVNAYDNALLYTDHVLATLIRQLQVLEPKVDSALIYVSDHGESLGERGLYLHGVPYAIAPDVQKQVPMVMWFSSGFAAARRLDVACMSKRAQDGASHDHLFHTVLGLLDVRTRVHEPPWDLSHGCVVKMLDVATR
jgi:lipid A ethanolaminephosphotransferase